MTKLIRYIVVALAVSAPASAARVKAPTQRARACSTEETRIQEAVAALRRELLAPLKTLADRMAEAENLEDLDEVIWELTTEQDVVRAAFVMGAVAAMAATELEPGALDELLAAESEEAPDGTEAQLRAAVGRLAEKSLRLVEGLSGEPAQAADAERAFEDFLAVGRSPFAPKGDRWYAQGTLRLVICAMGHIALESGALPAWIDGVVLDELALKAVAQAEEGLDLLLDDSRPDRRIARAAQGQALEAAGRGEPGGWVRLFDGEQPA